MSRTYPIWIAIILAVGAMVAGFGLFSDPLDQWSAATRYTARIGFPLLILAYVARPLTQLTRAGWAKHILQRRKHIGLGFAITHTVHLGAIIMLYRMLGEVPAPITIVFGGLAYVLLYAMAFTSNQRAMKALGKRWKQLHLIGIHYLWLIFFQSYAGRVYAPDYMVEGALFTAIALIAAAIRFAAWRKVRSSR